MMVEETAVEDDLVPSFKLVTAVKLYNTVKPLTKKPVLIYLHFSAAKNCIGAPFLCPLWLVHHTLTHDTCHTNTFLVEKTGEN